MSTTKLNTPDPNKPFVLHFDASEYAIGACLSQINDEGHERPIAFMSKKLTGCQRRWSPVEREALAVVHALNYFDVIVYGCHFDVYTDHDPLKYVICGAPSNSKLCRWSLSLQRFDMTAFHRAGHRNINADYFSRCEVIQ